MIRSYVFPIVFACLFQGHLLAQPSGFPGSNLPLFIINTSNGQPVTWEKKTAQFKIINNAQGVLNFPNDQPEFMGKVNIRIRGAFSSSLPQKPYLMETWTANEEDTSVVLLDLPAENDWILQATYNDKTFLRNKQMFDIAREAGQYAPRSRYGELFLNGEYQGIYFLCEKIKVDDNRVDIKKMDELDNDAPDVTGGYIFKHDYPDVGWTSTWHPPNCPDRTLDFQFVYPKPENITPAQAAYIQSYVDSFEQVLQSPQFSNPITGFRKYIDEDSFIDYLLLNEAARNGDGYKKSMYFSKDRNGKIKAGPIWDFDWALKFVPWAEDDLRGFQYLLEPCYEDIPIIFWFRRMMEDADFANRAACRWKELRSTVLDTTNLFNTIDMTEAYLQQAQKRHFDYWGTLGINVGTPETEPIPLTFAGEMERYKEFFRRRLSWYDHFIVGTCFTNAGHLQAETPSTVHIYPTLVNDVVYVEIPKNGCERPTIVISDLQGKVLQHSNDLFASERLTFDLSALPSGVYVVQIISSEGKTTAQKVLKL